MSLETGSLSPEWTTARIVEQFQGNGSAGLSGFRALGSSFLLVPGCKSTALKANLQALLDFGFRFQYGFPVCDGERRSNDGSSKCKYCSTNAACTDLNEPLQYVH